MWLDIVATKRTYDAKINGNVFTGYIQTLVREPVIIHMFMRSKYKFLLLPLWIITRIPMPLSR